MTATTTTKAKVGRILKIPYSCFLCNTHHSYIAKNKSFENWFIKKDGPGKGVYCCMLCYQKIFYLKHRTAILAIRRQVRDKNRKKPYKKRKSIKK